MKRKITIAVKNPGEPWEKRTVEDVLQVYQQIVGGYIEGAYTTSFGVHIFCNEEGKLNNMKRNIMTPTDVIFGPVFAVRDDGEGEFESLTKDDLKRLGITDDQDPDDPWTEEAVAEVGKKIMERLGL
jgi:hypothetical protein